MIIIAEINLIMHTSRIDEQIISNIDKHITSTLNASTRNRRDVVTSHAEALPKKLIAPHPYRFTRGGVPEAYCPIVRCTPEEGMEKM
jgi:hypothetical protein